MTYQPHRCIIEHIPGGADATTAQPGDFLLCHRRGIGSATIRLGERIKYHQGYWSHAAYIITPTEIIEALTGGVDRNPLSVYHDIDYALVHTALDPHDVLQANAFAESCVGQRYGYLTDVGIALRFLTPGRGLWLGMNGTEICSGLVAQAEVRGPVNFAVDPSSISPTELGRQYGAAR